MQHNTPQLGGPKKNLLQVPRAEPVGLLLGYGRAGFGS